MRNEEALISHFALLSISLLYQQPHLVIEGISLEQLFYIQMHTISPVMTRIGRDIDTLGIRIGQAQFFINSYPILERHQTEH